MRSASCLHKNDPCDPQQERLFVTLIKEGLTEAVEHGEYKQSVDSECLERTGETEIKRKAFGGIADMTQTRSVGSLLSVILQRKGAISAFPLNCLPEETARCAVSPAAFLRGAGPLPGGGGMTGLRKRKRKEWRYARYPPILKYR